MPAKLTTTYHNLSVLLDAGIPILKSLNMVTEGLKGHLKIIFSNISESVSKGNTLTDSIAKHRRAFGRMDIMMIKSAELSGNLSKCFKMLSEWYEFKSKIKHILLSGLLLPVLIIHIAIFIIPLPSVIKGGISVSKYLTMIIKILVSMYLAIGFLIVIYHSSQYTIRLRIILDAIILRIPFINEAIRQLSICRYCRGFNMLYKAGVPIKECATRAPEVTGNLVIASMFEGGAKSISEGKMAYEGFSKKLPLDYLNLWEIGEQTAELDKMVDKIAQISGDRAGHLFLEIAKWTPRILYFMVIITLAIIILTSATSLYSPNMP